LPGLSTSTKCNNPQDTGYAYSNAILGVFNSYSEANAQPLVQSRNTLTELFVQDNWRLTSGLTLDYGLRLSFMPPIVEKNNAIASFVPSLLDPSQQVQLIAPGLDGNRRVGVHPVTGQVYPASLIGAIAPGVGDRITDFWWLAPIRTTRVRSTRIQVRNGRHGLDSPMIYLATIVLRSVVVSGCSTTGQTSERG